MKIVVIIHPKNHRPASAKHPMATSVLREGDKFLGGDDYHPIVSVLANPRSQVLMNKGVCAIAAAVKQVSISKKEIAGRKVHVIFSIITPGNFYKKRGGCNEGTEKVI